MKAEDPNDTDNSCSNESISLRRLEQLRGQRPSAHAQLAVLNQGEKPQADRVREDSKDPVDPIQGCGRIDEALASLRNGAAGDPIPCVASRIGLHIVGLGMDDERRTAIGEHRVGARAQAHA